MGKHGKDGRPRSRQVCARPRTGLLLVRRALARDVVASSRHATRTEEPSMSRIPISAPILRRLATALVVAGVATISLQAKPALARS